MIVHGSGLHRCNSHTFTKLDRHSAQTLQQASHSHTPPLPHIARPAIAHTRAPGIPSATTNASGRSYDKQIPEPVVTGMALCVDRRRSAVFASLSRHMHVHALGVLVLQLMLVDPCVPLAPLGRPARPPSTVTILGGCPVWVPMGSRSTRPHWGTRLWQRQNGHATTAEPGGTPKCWRHW